MLLSNRCENIQYKGTLNLSQIHAWSSHFSVHMHLIHKMLEKPNKEGSGEMLKIKNARHMILATKLEHTYACHNYFTAQANKWCKETSNERMSNSKYKFQFKKYVQKFNLCMHAHCTLGNIKRHFSKSKCPPLYTIQQSCLFVDI